MEHGYTVDLISDLNLENNQVFDWSGKPTSLFCCIAGGISGNPTVIKNVLEHLSTMYRGVLYIDGGTEHKILPNHSDTIEQITNICKAVSNVIYLHNHVVVLNDVAFVGINGWYGNYAQHLNPGDKFMITALQNEDLAYLSTTIKSLQNRSDTKKIVVISNSIPTDYLMYGSVDLVNDGVEPGISLVLDRTKKVTHWLYGGGTILNDLFYNGRRYVNNPDIPGQPYWPKRILI